MAALIVGLWAGTADADCTQDWQNLTSQFSRLGPADIQIRDTGRIYDDQGWCVLEKGEITQDLLVFQIDHIRWKADGFEQQADLRSATVILDGLRMYAISGSPWIDHMMRESSYHNAATGEAALRWDNGTLGFSLRIGVQNGFDVSFVLDGSDPDGTIFRGGMPTDGAIRYLSLQVVNEGSFDTTLYSILSATLRSSGLDPENAIAAWKARMNAHIAQIPRALAGPQSKGALQELVGGMPMPHGEATLTLRTNAEIPLAPIVNAARSRAVPPVTEIVAVPVLS